MATRNVTLVRLEANHLNVPFKEILNGFLTYEGVTKGLRDERINGSLQFEPRVGSSVMLMCPPRDAGIARVVQTSAVKWMTEQDGSILFTTNSGSTYLLEPAQD